MSRKKPEWTEPGAAVDRVEINDALEASKGEASKGTAAAHPVLSLAPEQAHGSHAATPRTVTEGEVVDADHRSPAQIEAEIAATRERLAGTLDELQERLSPRGVLRQANSQARGVFVAEDGAVRKDRVALAAGALALVLGALVAVRKLRR